MRKSSFERCLVDFYIDMAWDIELLVKIQKAKKVVGSVHEKRSIFSAFVFSICANWEILVEELLIACLNKDTSGYKEFTGFRIPKDISRETCKAIILGVSYIDFKDVSNLKRIARKMLVPKFNPFKEIPRANGNKIDEFFALRNYLAHYSDVAKRRLEKIYRDRHGLRTFREPGDFLLAEDRRQRLPRMGAYINNFIETADIMGKFCNVDIL